MMVYWWAAMRALAYAAALTGILLWFLEELWAMLNGETHDPTRHPVRVHIQGDPSPMFRSLVVGVVATLPLDAQWRLRKVGLAVSQELIEEKGTITLGMCWGSIVLYEQAFVRKSLSHDDMKRRVRQTILHELAHSHGLNEDQVRALGY